MDLADGAGVRGNFLFLKDLPAGLYDLSPC